MGGTHPVVNRGRQVAALCWRLQPETGMPEILLVTSLRTRRWILPKGWPMRGMSSGEAAAMEALEEAGVGGVVSEAPIGRYHYLKEKRGRAVPCQVDVYGVEVRHTLVTWPEKGHRDITWLSPAEAAERLEEPELRELVRGFLPPAP